MKATDHTKFKKAIFAAVEKHLAKGGKLLVGSFSNAADGDYLCPISCLTGPEPGTHNNPLEYWKAAARISKTPFTEEDLWNLVEGFDHTGSLSDERTKTRMYKLGQQLRAKFLPKE